jgi:4-hydroxy-3-polyprenylbenzoate decarboxylase
MLDCKGHMSNRIIVAISGASGAIYGIRALEILRSLKIETHLILSESAKITVKQETNYQVNAIEALASVVHDHLDLSAPVASGSFLTQGMIIAPCSIKTLSAIANSYTADLIARAADVCLKEGRSLVMMVRETPLHRGHLGLMVRAAEMGAILFPPVPAFYSQPQTIDDIVTGSVGRALARLGIANNAYPRWKDEI